MPITDLVFAITADGQVKTIYSDELQELFAKLGRHKTRRATHVEPTAFGSQWYADCRPIGGDILGPFGTRAKALKAERVYINEIGLFNKEVSNEHIL